LVAADLEVDAAACGAAGVGVGPGDTEDVEPVVADRGHATQRRADVGLDAGARVVAAGAVGVVDLARQFGDGSGGAARVGRGELDVERNHVTGRGPG
jgi:hypothetical protein